MPIGHFWFEDTPYVMREYHSHARLNTQSVCVLRAMFAGFRIIIASKVMLTIVDAPQYVPNSVNRTDLQTPSAKGIRPYSSQYSARLSVHTNDTVVNLRAQPDNRRLRRY
jgi:hypothetical protein